MGDNRVVAFEDCYVPEPNSGCWLWIKNTNPYGYGRYPSGVPGRRYVMAHRKSYELARGPIPDGLDLDHLCRVKSCVNPAHLEPVTNRENILRGIGPTASNAKKQVCHKGHLLTPTVKGWRRCLICAAAKNRVYRALRGRSEEGK